MTIQMKIKGNQDCPVVCCDQCDGEIPNAGEGVYAWYRWVGVDNTNMTQVPSFLHKGDCMREWQKANDSDGHGRYASECMWMPLSVFTVFLANGLHVDGPRARELAEALSSF